MKKPLKKCAMGSLVVERASVIRRTCGGVERVEVTPGVCSELELVGFLPRVRGVVID